jgi:hypothetical protein
MLSLSDNSLHSRILRIQSSSRDRISTPNWRFHIIHRKGKENKQRAECQSQIQSAASQIVQS